MRGPIDYIIVGFEGNKFDGSVLKALGDALEQGVIGLVALSMLVKDEVGNVTTLNVADTGDEYLVDMSEKYGKDAIGVDQSDIDEVADLIENNCSAGLLVVEQLWAKPLKKALIDANGVLIAEGRIHPEAAAELSNKEGE